MMSRANPWDEIGTPDADYTVRRVADSKLVPLFWGKDKDGACLLIVDLEGDHSAQFRRDGTSVHGIGVDLRQGDDPGNQRLVLTLEKHVDRDLFFGLCETLVFSRRPQRLAYSHKALEGISRGSQNWRIVTRTSARSLCRTSVFAITLQGTSDGDDGGRWMVRR
jgi:hypothetical protein